MNEPLTRDDIRHEWIKAIADQDSKYHLTISFPANTSQRETRKLLNILLLHLNRKIYNRQYAKGRKFLSGFAIEEYTHKMSAHHYHILIANDEWLPTYWSFHQLIHMQIQFFNGQQLRIDRSSPTQLRRDYVARQMKEGGLKDMFLRQTRDLTPRKMNNCIETWKLQEYYNDGDNKLEQYITKSFERLPYRHAVNADFIGVLTDQDAQFGNG